jgi:hypothetical protein
MRNGLRFAAVVAMACGAMTCTGLSMAADQPQISKSIVKQLKAAQDAEQAKHYDEALNDVNQAKAVAGEKTPYDNFVINGLLIKIYQGQNNQADLVKTLEATAQSQYATPEQQKTFYSFVAGYYYQTKDYNKAIDSAQEAQKHGAAGDPKLADLIANSYFLTNRFKEAAQAEQEIVSKQDKPDETTLTKLWQFDQKAGDQAGADKAIDRLVALYPKPEYWSNALVSLTKMDVKDSHLQLNIYRLKKDVGAMRQPGEYADMAVLALDQGYPGETVTILQDAFQKNVFVEQRDKDRNQHLLDGAKGRAQQDQQQLGKTEPADGNGLVQLGAAYMSYGQNDKAITYINKGLQQGGLKSADEANLLLGIAQFKAKNTAEAQKAFEKVAASSNPGYARLGKLWQLHAGAGRGA